MADLELAVVVRLKVVDVGEISQKKLREYSIEYSVQGLLWGSALAYLFWPYLSVPDMLGLWKFALHESIMWSEMATKYIPNYQFLNIYDRVTGTTVRLDYNTFLDFCVRTKIQFSVLLLTQCCVVLQWCYQSRDFHAHWRINGFQWEETRLCKREWVLPYDLTMSLVVRPTVKPWSPAI